MPQNNITEEEYKLLSRSEQILLDTMQSIRIEVDTTNRRLDQVVSDITIRLDQVISENRARHYDMQNISLGANNISLSGHVSSSQAAGRSPRIKLNSFDTFHWYSNFL